MRHFFDLDEAVGSIYGDVEWGPDHWENVRRDGHWVTELTWWPDEEGGKDSHDYIDYDGWDEWALGHGYKGVVKIVKDGIFVYD